MIYHADDVVSCEVDATVGNVVVVESESTALPPKSIHIYIYRCNSRKCWIGCW